MQSAQPISPGASQDQTALWPSTIPGLVVQKPTVYLAGPINGLTYAEAIGWRHNARLMLEPNFYVLDPMRDKDGHDQSAVIGSYAPNLLMYRPDVIVARDLYDIDRADALLMKGLQGTVGTAIELGYAVARAKPVVLILEENDSMNEHPFVQALPRIIVVTNVYIAVSMLFSLLGVR